jgi:hypothetical protein
MTSGVLRSHGSVARPFADFAARAVKALRATFQTSTDRTPTPPKPHPAHREAFIEDAALKREMFRL